MEIWECRHVSGLGNKHTCLRHRCRYICVSLEGDEVSQLGRISGGFLAL